MKRKMVVCSQGTRHFGEKRYQQLYNARKCRETNDDIALHCNNTRKAVIMRFIATSAFRLDVLQSCNIDCGQKKNFISYVVL